MFLLNTKTLPTVWWLILYSHCHIHHVHLYSESRISILRSSVSIISTWIITLVMVSLSFTCQKHRLGAAIKMSSDWFSRCKRNFLKFSLSLRENNHFKTLSLINNLLQILITLLKVKTILTHICNNNNMDNSHNLQVTITILASQDMEDTINHNKGMVNNHLMLEWCNHNNLHLIHLDHHQLWVILYPSVSQFNLSKTTLHWLLQSWRLK